MQTQLSPKAKGITSMTRPGVTYEELANVCWNAIEGPRGLGDRRG